MGAGPHLTKEVHCPQRDRPKIWIFRLSNILKTSIQHLERKNRPSDRPIQVRMKQSIWSKREDEPIYKKPIESPHRLSGSVP